MSPRPRLEARIAARIAENGPISIADYMLVCLHDPQDGYYAARPSIGAEGDFITAPMVSQMFGELIGLWAVEVWRRMGSPAPVRLVELGPGDGTLMQDALRAARLAPGFLTAAEVWLVETSRPLRALQAERLALAGPRWVERIDQMPEGPPAIVIGNEILDCLPAHQFVRTASGWAERRVGLDAEGGLAFGLAPAPPGFAGPADAPEGILVEASPAQAAMGHALGELIARDGGAALLIDYGRDRPGVGDTLQALKGHRKVPPLETPGEADLTVHADFPAVAAAARSTGVETTTILTQAAFLGALGVRARAAALVAARPDQGAVIMRQLGRLTDPDQMGALFKVVGVHSPGLPLPGFEEA